MKNYDFVILGGGASAFAAAIKANELGAKTAMVQGPLPLGGTCVNVGCVPSKTLIHAAELVQRTRKEHLGGIRLALSNFDYGQVIRGELELVAALRRQKYESVLQGLPNVSLLAGTARFLDPQTIGVGTERIGAERFLIATGTTALPPGIPGLSEAGFLTHATALSSEHLPGSLLVLGSGPVGLEFAQIFARFGSRVTLVSRDRQLFPRTEPELSRRLEAVFAEEGITVLKNAVVTAVRAGGNGKAVTVSDGEGERTVTVEEILVGTGKVPNTRTLGLERAGVRVDAKAAVVASPTLQTSAPHIFTAGDVANLPRRLETTAGREGTFAAENALRGTRHSLDYQTVPWTVFTDPQLAGVGLLDAEVSEHGLSCTCNTVGFEHVAKAHILGDTRGMVKMVMDRTSRRIVGVHLLAENAGDLIGAGELILKKQMTVDDVLETLPVFPTLSESIRIGAQSLVTDVSKLSCCV